MREEYGMSVVAAQADFVSGYKTDAIE